MYQKMPSNVLSRDAYLLNWFRNFVYDIITYQLKFTENVLVHACEIIKVIFFFKKAAMSISNNNVCLRPKHVGP